jgi:hypothetical protein
MAKAANSRRQLFPAGFFGGEKKINLVIHRKRDAVSATLGGKFQIKHRGTYDSIKNSPAKKGGP